MQYSRINYERTIFGQQTLLHYHVRVLKPRHTRWPNVRLCKHHLFQSKAKKPQNEFHFQGFVKISVFIPERQGQVIIPRTTKCTWLPNKQ